MPYDALRKGRVSETGRAYLITTVTRGRVPRFLNLWCARAVITEMRHLHEEGLVYSLSWVLMPDHLHWLFQLKDGGSLGLVMKLFKGRSSRALSGITGRVGPVWQKAYHDRALRDGEDMRAIARYLVANPLRAGLAENVGAYSHWDADWL